MFVLPFALLWATAVGDAPIRYAAQHVRRQDHKDCFIVKLKPNATEGREHEMFEETRGSHGRSWDTALRGFFRCNVSAEALRWLASDPDVESISEDTVYTKTATESNAPWNLQRIVQRSLPLLGSYTYTATGQGVYVYIVDTGINSAHTDFTGRIVRGADFVGDGQGTNDCQGHGTHVSGIAAGTTYGVAKQAYVVPVRTMDCTGSGTNSAIISGISWAVSQFKAGQRPGVINLSLGGSLSTALNAAVAGAVAAGMPVAVAAGNANTDACGTSPASETTALTVGATNSADARASYSNYGTCVKLFAPGDLITSDYIGSSTATQVESGTSAASPHVAGAAALYLSLNPSATPTQVRSWLTSSATANVVTSPGTGSPNLLLYVGGLGITAAPSASADPSQSPDSSRSPGTSPSPDSSPSPNSSRSPGTSPSPDSSPSPNSSRSPGTSPSPDVSPSPNSSRSPGTSPSPDASPSPAASPVAPMASPSPAQGIPSASSPSTVSTNAVCFELVGDPSSYGTIGWSITQRRNVYANQPASSTTVTATVCLLPGQYAFTVIVRGPTGGQLTAIQNGAVVFSLQPLRTSLYTLTIQSSYGAASVGSKQLTLTWLKYEDGDTVADSGAQGSNAAFYGLLGLLFLLPITGFFVWRWARRPTAEGLQDVILDDVLVEAPVFTEARPSPAASPLPELLQRGCVTPPPTPAVTEAAC